jgi:hypothetical protein
MSPTLRFSARALLGLALFGWGCDGGSSGEADGGGKVPAPDSSVDGPVSPVSPVSTVCPPLGACASASSCPPSDAEASGACGWECDLTPICGAAAFTYPSNGCSSSGCAGSDASAVPTFDETAVRCVLGALRDGTLGELDWGVAYNDMFDSAQTAQIDVVGERQAYGWSVSQSDTVVSTQYSGRLLQAPSFFQACLDSNDSGQYVGCLMNALQPCQ